MRENTDQNNSEYELFLRSDAYNLTFTNVLFWQVPFWLTFDILDGCLQKFDTQRKQPHILFDGTQRKIKVIQGGIINFLAEGIEVTNKSFPRKVVPIFRNFWLK